MCNSGASHILRYMIKEHMHVCCHPNIECSYGGLEGIIKYAYGMFIVLCMYIKYGMHIFFNTWLKDITESSNLNIMKSVEAFIQWMMRRRFRAASPCCLKECEDE